MKRFFNEDDGLKNQESDQQAIGTGETVNLNFELKESTADKCIGASYTPNDLLASKRIF